MHYHANDLRSSIGSCADTRNPRVDGVSGTRHAEVGDDQSLVNQIIWPRRGNQRLANENCEKDFALETSRKKVFDLP